MSEKERDWGKYRNWVIRYESWEGYNAESKEEAIKKFLEDGHTMDELVSIE